MRILVTGGGGYIGSHMVKMLGRAGHEVTTYDDFSTGHRDAVLGGRVVAGDIRDEELLTRTLRSDRIDAVLHFAARSIVGESRQEPGMYYSVNVCGTRALLDAMRRAGIGMLVFSSSAAIYGEPEALAIREDHAKRPLHPYGASKWMVERMLEDEDRAYGTRSVSLRYFNAAGADREGELGERHDPETHLIPLACRAACRTGAGLTVFGGDYPTVDGTCVRDFIHVEDLCRAHLRALEYLSRDGRTIALNAGYGVGFSVREVVQAVQRVTGLTVPVTEGAPRPGDPARLVADATRIRHTLDWHPLYADLSQIIRDAWQWERRRLRAD